VADTTHIVDMLGKVDLFADVPVRARRRIASAGREVQHAPNREVTTEGESGIGFHLVLDGEFLVESAGTVRPTLGPGDYFGEISMLDGLPRTATVRSGPQGARTFSITAWQFAPLLDEHPEIAKPLLRTLCRRLRDQIARSPA
jgi:CRP/FNR family cyclic AMP-dependent transcriptional regulator